MIAEACNPEWASVPLEGWSHAQALAKIADVHLVTQIRNREAILRAGLKEGSDFTALDSEAIARPIYRFGELIRGGKGKGWTTLAAISVFSYYYFEHLLWKQFGRRIRNGDFDVVHRITPLSPTAPSIIAGKCRREGVPFVIGPLNGGVPWPKQFDAARRKEREWLSYLRSVYRLLPGYRSTLRNAGALIGGSGDTLSQIPKRYRDKCVYIPENAIDPARFSVGRTRKAQPPIKVVFVGRLVPYKGADMLIEAVAPMAKSGLLTVEIIGDGPQRMELEKLIDREGIQSNVKMLGWVVHEKVQNYLVEADIFGFPSIREFGGAVVLEAMACGLVPVVVDYAGPGELVTDRTGFRIPMGSRDQIVANFRRTLGELAANPDRLDGISQCAIHRAREKFTWDAKAAQVLQVYEWVVGRRNEKPQFALPVPDAIEQLVRI